MDFLKPILSVLPSIINVVGGLFGANENDYIRIPLRLPSSQPDSDNDAKIDGVYFWQKEDGQIWAGNQNKENVQISFPAENGAFGDSYVLRHNEQFPVNNTIRLHAAANVDTFEITTGGNPPIPAQGAEAGKNSAVITAFGKVDKHATGPVQISTDISVEISGNDLSILVQDHFTLEGIPLLTISGEGNEPKTKYQNVIAGQPIPVPKADAGAKTETDDSRITFPDALSRYVYSDYVSISVSVNCSYNSNSEKLKALRTRQGIIKGTDKDWEFLKKGKCLNP